MRGEVCVFVHVCQCCDFLFFLFSGMGIFFVVFFVDVCEVCVDCVMNVYFNDNFCSQCELPGSEILVY